MASPDPSAEASRDTVELPRADAAEPFPELGAEQERLAFARDWRNRMIERFEAVDRARYDEVASALVDGDFAPADHVHDLAHDDVPLFDPPSVEGLEFDRVVVEPHEILDGTTRGVRLLYVAMTRAVQELAFVTPADPPELIAP